MQSDPQTARVNVTVNGTRDRIYHCATFIVRTYFTNMAAGRIAQPGGPQVLHP